MKQCASLLVLPSRLLFLAMMLFIGSKILPPEGLFRSGVRWVATGLLVWGLIYPFARSLHWLGKR